MCACRDFAKVIWCLLQTFGGCLLDRNSDGVSNPPGPAALLNTLSYLRTGVVGNLQANMLSSRFLSVFSLDW